MMAELKTVLADMVKPIVVHPEDVVVAESESNGIVTLSLSVNPSDMGKVIGKHGKIAGSLRLVMKAVGNKCGKKINVEILE